MAGRFKQAFRVASVLVLAGVAAFGTSAGVPRRANAPRPWAERWRPLNVQFTSSLGNPRGRLSAGSISASNTSRTVRHSPQTPRDVVLTSKAWTDMVKVNAWVNRSIKPITDLEHWGVVERWNYPDDGYGDCEDYVLLKRRMLMQAGWPREALLITVVRDKKGDGHAVLTVKTDRGEFILDNQEPQVLPWTKTGYRFVKRQSQSDPNLWVSLGEPRVAPATVSAR